MRGGGRHEKIDDDVELLDVDADVGLHVEPLETASNTRSGAMILALAAIAATALVVGVGNSPSPPAEPPPVTIDEEPAEVERPLTEREQQEADFGVAIGEGPGLVWQPVDINSNARFWRWSNGGFHAGNGTTEWSISLVGSDPTVTERASLLIDYPGYRAGRIEGGQLLVPDEPIPDHLVIVVDDSEPVRIDVISTIEPSASGLTETNVWFYGAIIGDRAVIHRSAYVEVDIAALEALTQRDLTGVVHVSVQGDRLDLYTSGPGPIPEPIALADTDLSEDEVNELRSIGQPIGDVLTADLLTGEAQPVDLPDFEYQNDLLIGLDDELLLGWTDQGGKSWLSSTVDGVTWSTERRGVARWLVNSGTQLFDFNSQGSSISRSSDGGQSWNVTPVPLTETQQTVAGDVVVLGESWMENEIGGVSVETDSDQFSLYMFDKGQRFELRGPSPFAEPMTGWTYDPASGAEWDWTTNSLVFSEVRTGNELLRVSGHAVESAIAAQHPMEQMALTRWPADVSNPEWLIVSPVDVFGEGSLRAEFVSGGKYLLAIITTVDGYEFFIADTELP